MLSQEDKPKRYRSGSAREISHKTGIRRSSVHRIIHRDIQLKRFKQHRAQLLSEANRVAVSLAVKQPFRLQYILLLFSYKPYVK